MAIVFENLSTCPLCGELLTKTKAYMLVPPMVSNVKDVLFSVNDSGVHLECLDQSAIKNSLLQCIELYNRSLPLSKTVCAIDGGLVINPDDAIFTGLLSSDENEKIYKFNFTMLNRGNVSNGRRKMNLSNWQTNFFNRENG